MAARVVNIRHVIHGRKKSRDTISVAVSDLGSKRYLNISEGVSLQKAISDWADLNGRAAGAFTVIGGELRSASYVVATPKEYSSRVIEYGSPERLRDPVLLLSGDGAYGYEANGELLIHLHGALSDGAGHTVGGHLNPADCIAGPSGMLARMFCGAVFKRELDFETGFRIFEPALRSLDHGCD